MMLTEVNQAQERPLRYLGPAEVIGRTGPQLRVTTPSGEARARLALAYPYSPEIGDVVLVIAQDDEHWVIGVVRGQGKVNLEFSGDVAVRAVDGTLELAGDRGVKVEGPAVQFKAGKLTMLADTMVQTFTMAYQRVSELLSFRAGRMHTVVREDSLSKAKRMTMLADDNVNVNGKQIRLG